MTTKNPHWERVAAIGLPSPMPTHGDEHHNLPGTFEVHCFRTPTTTLEDAPYGVELNNHETGESARVTITRTGLLSMAHGLLNAALHAHPVDIDPSVYFMPDTEGTH